MNAIKKNLVDRERALLTEYYACPRKQRRINYE